MEKDEHKSIASGLIGVAAGLNPLTSVTFLLALLVLASAGWVWFKHSGEAVRSFPIYGTVAASYAGGFVTGRVFRRALKTAAIVAAIVLGDARAAEPRAYRYVQCGAGRESQFHLAEKAIGPSQQLLNAPAAVRCRRRSRGFRRRPASARPHLKEEYR